MFCNDLNFRDDIVRYFKRIKKVRVYKNLREETKVGGLCGTIVNMIKCILMTVLLTLGAVWLCVCHTYQFFRSKLPQKRSECIKFIVSRVLQFVVVIALTWAVLYVFYGVLLSLRFVMSTTFGWVFTKMVNPVVMASVLVLSLIGMVISLRYTKK